MNLKRRMTPETAAAFKQAAEGVRGKPLMELAAEYGISYALARKIVSGQSYTDIRPAVGLTEADVAAAYRRARLRRQKPDGWPRFAIADVEDALDRVHAIAARMAALSAPAITPNPPRYIQILYWIDTFIRSNHYPPANRETAAAFGVHESVIRKHLRTLQTLGYVTWRKGAQRSIEVLRLPGEDAERAA